MNGFVDESNGGAVVLHGRSFDVGEFVDAVDRHLAVLNFVEQRCVGKSDMQLVHLPMVRQVVAPPHRLHQQLLESLRVDEARVYEECGGAFIFLQHLQNVTE